MKTKVFAALLILATALSCSDRLFEYGDRTVVIHSVPDRYHAVEAAGGFVLVLDRTVPPGEIEITAAESIHPYVSVKSSGGVLRIGMRSGVSYSGLHLEARMSPRGLVHMGASGGSTVTSEDPLRADELDLSLSGGSYAELSGFVGVLSCRLSGGSRAMLGSLRSVSLDADLSGGSVAYVCVTESLSLDASGGSALYYEGDPFRRAVHLSGGSVCARTGW